MKKGSKIFLATLLTCLCIGVLGVAVYFGVKRTYTVTNTITFNVGEDVPLRCNSAKSYETSSDNLPTWGKSTSLNGTEKNGGVWSATSESEVTEKTWSVNNRALSMFGIDTIVYHFEFENYDTEDGNSVKASIKLSAPIQNNSTFVFQSSSESGLAALSSTEREMSFLQDRIITFELAPTEKLYVALTIKTSNLSTNYLDIGFNPIFNFEIGEAPKQIANLSNLDSLDSIRPNIMSISVSDTLPTGDTYDVSYAEDESLYGYYNTTTYAFVIHSDKPVLLPEDCSSYFAGMTSLTSVDFAGIESFETINFSAFLNNINYTYDTPASALTTLSNFNKLDTSSAVNLSKMFYGCSALESIELKNMSTYNVQTMEELFYGCEVLTTINVAGFKTSNVTSMCKLFNFCKSLISLDLSNFDTAKVTDFAAMFQNCANLSELNILSFNTSNATSILYMFSACKELTSLNLSNFDTSKVTSMQTMFQNCEKLTELDISNFNTSEATNMSFMFNGCKEITKLNLSNFNTSKVTSMRTMFQNCEKLTELNISSFDTSVVEDMSFMFSGCSGLTDLNISSFNTSEATMMKAMFLNCSNLTSLDVTGFDTSKVTDMQSMFNTCSNLTSLDVSEFDTSKVTNMRMMFNKCSKLTCLDISNFDMTKVTDAKAMCQYVEKATTIYLPDSFVIDDYTLVHMPCVNATTFTIKATMRVIGTISMWYNFGTDNFTTFVDDGNAGVEVIDGILYTADAKTLIAVPMGKTFDDNTFILPDSVTDVYQFSFNRNKHIDTVVMPNGFELYGQEEESIVIASNLSIGIFCYTTVSEYEVNDDNTNYSSYNGCIYSKDGETLLAVPLNYIGELFIKEGTLNIENDAFYEGILRNGGINNSVLSNILTKIIFPASLTNINEEQLAALNALGANTSCNVILEIDAGNTVYRIENNQIVVIGD